MQTRAVPVSGPRDAQHIHGLVEDDDHIPMPPHIQREQERQAAQARGFLSREDEVAESGNPTKMYDLLWPIAFWCVTAINLMNLAAASFSMAGSYDVWKHLNVCAITIGCITAMILVDKWVIRGQDGLPRFHKRQPE